MGSMTEFADRTVSTPQKDLKTMGMSRMPMLLLAIVWLCGASTVVAQQRYLPAEVEAGSRLYQSNCTFCHGPEGDGISGVNFSKGANPPREKWKLPPTKTAEESRVAYQTFEDYIHFIQRFPEVQFITATEAVKNDHTMTFSPRRSINSARIASRAEIFAGTSR